MTLSLLRYFSLPNLGPSADMKNIEGFALLIELNTFCVNFGLLKTRKSTSDDGVLIIFTFIQII